MYSIIKVLLFVALSLQTFASDNAVVANPLIKKNLSLLSNESQNFINQIIVKGEKPQVIYVPIIHDGPYNHMSSTNIDNVQTILDNCEQISALLYKDYEVKNVLLEGMSKKVAEWYNNDGMKGKKIKFNSRMKTWKAWANILNQDKWNAVAASNKKLEGPLTKLGYEYSNRIVKALDKSKKNGWFRSRENFTSNQKEFQKLIADACAGYNDKMDAIIAKDPMLKGEFDITVTQRNRVFIENTMEAQGPGIIFCGAAHTHNLIEQIEKKNIPYAIIVPKGLEWPIKKKDDATIFSDMLKLGCQLKEVSLTFGDGTSAKIKMPIK